MLFTECFCFFSGAPAAVYQLTSALDAVVSYVACADAHVQLLKDIARTAKVVAASFKHRSTLQEDVSCVDAVLDAVKEKVAAVEVRACICGRPVVIWASGTCWCRCGRVRAGVGRCRPV